jgi:hypothetical protein
MPGKRAYRTSEVILYMSGYATYQAQLVRGFRHRSARQAGWETKQDFFPQHVRLVEPKIPTVVVGFAQRRT